MAAPVRKGPRPHAEDVIRHGLPPKPTVQPTAPDDDETVTTCQCGDPANRYAYHRYADDGDCIIENAVEPLCDQPDCVWPTMGGRCTAHRIRARKVQA